MSSIRLTPEQLGTTDRIGLYAAGERADEPCAGVEFEAGDVEAKRLGHREERPADKQASGEEKACDHAQANAADLIDERGEPHGAFGHERPDRQPCGEEAREKHNQIGHAE